jgi:hypothetical protein
MSEYHSSCNTSLTVSEQYHGAFCNYVTMTYKAAAPFLDHSMFNPLLFILTLSLRVFIYPNTWGGGDFICL